MDLLLELNGTTDPRNRDLEQLKQLRIQSAMLSAIEKQDFSGEQLAKKIDDTTAQLLTLDRPPIGLLTVAAAIAQKREKREQLNAICTAISRLDQAGERQGVSPPSSSQQASQIAASRYHFAAMMICTEFC